MGQKGIFYMYVELSATVCLSVFSILALFFSIYLSPFPAFPLLCHVKYIANSKVY